MNYKKQASDFMAKTGTTLTVKYIENRPYFPDDKDSRDVYRFTIKRNGKRYMSTFGQSIADSRHPRKIPDAYHILAGIEKYDPENFSYFCQEYGYSKDSRTAEKTYKAVKKQWGRVNDIFGDVLDELREIT